MTRGLGPLSGLGGGIVTLPGLNLSSPTAGYLVGKDPSGTKGGIFKFTSTTELTLRNLADSGYGGLTVNSLISYGQVLASYFSTSGSILLGIGPDPVGIYDYARVFCREVGGKEQLCVIFGTGAVQVIASEP